MIGSVHPPVWAVVPMKALDQAKRRLAPILSADERAELARLMLDDVLETLAGCPRLAGTIVITRDPAAATLARRRGATLIDDPGPDLNGAVSAASKFLSTHQDAGMIVVPSDLPLLRPSVINDAIDCLARPPAVALVEAVRDGGTNLLACRPADVIPPSFGADSFRLHAHASRMRAIMPTIIDSEDAALDIDICEDLAAFLRRRTGTRSHAFLAALRIDQRLPAAPLAVSAASVDEPVR